MGGQEGSGAVPGSGRAILAYGLSSAPASYLDLDGFGRDLNPFSESGG
jgi:hypothetical protein